MAILDTTPAPNTPAPIWSTLLRYGSFCGLALVVYSLISYLLGLNPMSMGMMALNFILALLISTGFAAIAIRFQRDNLDGGFMKYGRGLLIGLGVVFVGSIISGLWNYVLFNFVDPGYADTMKDQFMETWGENMPAEAAEEATKGFDKMKSLGSNLTNGVIGGLVLGLISGLIASAFMKRDRPLE